MTQHTAALVTLCANCYHTVQTAKCYLSHCANCHKEAPKGLFDDAAHCCLLHPPTTTHLSHFVQIVQKCATSCHTVQSVRCVNCAAYGSPTLKQHHQDTHVTVCNAMYIVQCTCRFCSVAYQQSVQFALCPPCTALWCVIQTMLVCYSKFVVSTL